MDKFSAFVSVSFRRSLQYKVSIIFRIFSSFIYLTIQVFFWKVIYSNGGNKMAMPYSQMISYLIISQSIGLLVFNTDYLHYIKGDIREGRIINHLVRPYDYMFRYLCENIGKYFSSLLLTVIPMLVLCILFFHITPPANAHSLVVACMFALLSFIVYFLMNFILGLTMFWVLDMNGLIPIITGCVFQICSGAILPLVYYPAVIRKIIYCLPFRFSADVPFNIYIGNLSNTRDIIGYIILLIFWIGFLFLIERIIWKRALKKLCVQGG